MLPDEMIRTAEGVLRLISILTLISAFALSAVASYVACYVVMVGLLVMLVTSQGWRAYRRPAALALVLAFLSITLAALLAGPGVPGNWLGPAILIVPLLALGFPALGRHALPLSSPVAIAGLSLVGAGLGLLGGLADIVLNHAERAGVFNNPIHFSGLMVLLGFVSLVGFEASKAKWRHVFLAGPVFGMGGVLLSGSRGPFLAALALGILFAPAILYWHRRDRWLWTSLVVLAVGLSAVLVISPLGPRAAGGIMELVAGLGSGNLTAVDEGRSQMLAGAFGAFADSPLWGHGWAGMMAAAEAHFPADSLFLGYDHLHADIANFAVMGGALGLFAYALLILAPILAMLSVPPANRRSALVVGGTASVGFLVLGMTNSMFGILPQTVLYATLMGWLFLLAEGDGAQDLTDPL